MQISASELLEKRLLLLQEKRSILKKVPGIALIWLGEDEQTAKFIKAKQKMAQVLDCQFFLHHFPDVSERQLVSIIDGINQKKEVNGIVIQLPLPKHFDQEDYIARINPLKDIDGLVPNSRFAAPTPSGIVALIKENGIDPATSSTIIIGDGRLVGKPLADIFRTNNWKFDQITEGAASKASEIAKHNLVISCTGVNGIISPEMVTKDTVLIDGTGVDVDVTALEPLVKMITPKKGAIGPLTVSFLFENLLSAC